MPGEEDGSAPGGLPARVLDALPHNVYVVEATSYQVVWANRALLPRGLAEPPKCHALTHGLPRPCGDAEHPCPLREVVRTGRPVMAEHVHLGADGRPRRVEVHGYPLLDAAGTVARMVEFALEVPERQGTGEAPAAREDERLGDLLEDACELVQSVDAEGRFLYVNAAWLRALGYARSELGGLRLRDVVHADDRERCAALLGRVMAGEAVPAVEVAFVAKDGSTLLLEGSLSAGLAGGKAGSCRAILRDVTERRRMLMAMQEAQRLEALGLLAGGVAHDFNNILTAVKAYAGFILESLPDDGQNRADAQGILASADRAAKLTRQLLAFSRRQILSPSVVDLNDVVRAMTGMLARLIGEDVELRANLAPVPCPALVDAAQVEQILMNLVVNARDAMPDGGTVRIETRLAAPGAEFFVARPELRDVPLVCLSVTDTGRGMDDAVKARAFEPFFTTKAKGVGTGLGLSMVLGVVKQSGGDLELDSTPGRGTAFRLFFPLAKGTGGAEPREPSAARPPDPRGRETVLVAEDEPGIRRVVARALERHGYAVMTAADGEDALRQLARRRSPVDLLVTDLVMPGMGGRALAREAERRGLARRTLYITGYAGETEEEGHALPPGAAFLHKPFTPFELAVKCRETLDGPPSHHRL